MTERPRTIGNDILDMVEAATAQWTRQKKSEEKHPANIRYRESRLTKEPRMTQKEAAWQIMEAAYMAASGGGALPASARQIYYQARPKIMALTDDKELAYNYFSQTLLPDYVEENALDWRVVYDARGHFEEPHTHRNIGCGTGEVAGYLQAAKEPDIIAAAFAAASVDVIGPSSGNLSGVLFCEKEGFSPLFRAVKLADRYDLMIVSTKGVSVTAARRLIDNICGRCHLPLFTLHDFDVAGFLILATLQRDTRRYQFARSFVTVDLGLRLDDIEGLAREPAAASKVAAAILRQQLADNSATDAEIAILVRERVELNAMTSDALVAMIERKLKAHGLKKAIPDDDLLAETYRAFHRSDCLQEKFEEVEAAFDAEAGAVAVPADLRTQVEAILAEHPDLRWDEAIWVVLDATQLDHVRAEKEKARKKSGDFTDLFDGIFIDDDEDAGDDDDEG